MLEEQANFWARSAESDAAKGFEAIAARSVLNGGGDLRFVFGVGLRVAGRVRSGSWACGSQSELLCYDVRRRSAQLAANLPPARGAR
jgi:hypothetical protein